MRGRDEEREECLEAQAGAPHPVLFCPILGSRGEGRGRARGRSGATSLPPCPCARPLYRLHAARNECWGVPAGKVVRLGGMELGRPENAEGENAEGPHVDRHRSASPSARAGSERANNSEWA